MLSFFANQTHKAKQNKNAAHTNMIVHFSFVWYLRLFIKLNLLYLNFLLLLLSLF